MKMIDQFNDWKEKKADANKVLTKKPAKGPVDLKVIRQELSALNAKNRRPS